MAQDPVYAQHWLDLYPSIPAPGGERYDDFRDRIQSTMDAIAREVREGCAAVVTHAGVIRTFLSEIVDAPDQPADLSKCDYTSCWEVRYEAGKWSLLKSSTSPSAAPLAATK